MRRARAIARFVPDCAVLFARLARDPRTPRRHRVALVATAAYLASPIDLIPDFIPVLGLLDDAVVVWVMLRRLLRGAGPEMVRLHWPGPESTLRALLRLAAGPAAEGTLDVPDGHSRDDGADHDAPDGGIGDRGDRARLAQAGGRPRGGG